jgi:hypothetical protein
MPVTPNHYRFRISNFEFRICHPSTRLNRQERKEREDDAKGIVHFEEDKTLCVLCVFAVQQEQVGA